MEREGVIMKVAKPTDWVNSLVISLEKSRTVDFVYVLIQKT